MRRPSRIFGLAACKFKLTCNFVSLSNETTHSMSRTDDMPIFVRGLFQVAVEGHVGWEGSLYGQSCN